MNTSRLTHMLAIGTLLAAPLSNQATAADDQLSAAPVVTEEHVIVAIRMPRRDADEFRFAFHADARLAAEEALNDISVEFDGKKPLAKALRLASLEQRDRG
jgi:hypothetical protein